MNNSELTFARQKISSLQYIWSKSNKEKYMKHKQKYAKKEEEIQEQHYEIIVPDNLKDVLNQEDLQKSSDDFLSIIDKKKWTFI